MSKHILKVNTNLLFEVTNQDAETLDVISVSETESHVVKKNTSYTTKIITSDFNQKRYTVQVNNNTYDIEIADPLDQLIDTMGFTIGASKQVNEIKAPMPGLLLDIQVKVGQEVKQDDYLLVLEAMKMENIITSPRDGVIKSIAIDAGATVEKGQLLIEFEA